MACSRTYDQADEMTCLRGNASPKMPTRLRLFAQSAGHCQRPECRQPLFLGDGNTTVHYGEVAHIIAASPTGPRGNASPSIAVASYENLILLCPTCHTIIDKAPEAYPVSLVREWKRQHARRLAEAFGAVEYPDRASARHAIEPALGENRAIFDHYGPHNPYRMDPESEDAAVWQRKVRSTVLPNNRKVLLVLDANRRHLSTEEKKVVEAFRLHVDDLEARHLGVEGAVRGCRFPQRMNAVLSGDA